MAADYILGATFIDRFINSIVPRRRTGMFYKALPVAMLGSTKSSKNISSQKVPHGRVSKDSVEYVVQQGSYHKTGFPPTNEAD